jgi:hypothetical protein
MDATTSKFEREKMKRILRTYLFMYRNAKLDLPQNQFSIELVRIANEIDPNNTMPARELIDKVLEDGKLISMANALPSLSLPDDVIRDYAKEFYELTKAALYAKTSKELDALEYQSQQMQSLMLSADNQKFIAMLGKCVDEDKDAPYILKKFLNKILLAEPLGGEKKEPSDEEELLAEKIIDLTCPKLDKKYPIVFRALVDSFKWRGKDELESTLKSIERTPPERRKLRGRESCLFIETDDRVHYVG